MWPVRAALSIAATTAIALVAIVSEHGGVVRPLLALVMLAALALAASILASRPRSRGSVIGSRGSSSAPTRAAGPPRTRARTRRSSSRR
jgi:hypothetical protein